VCFEMGEEPLTVRLRLEGSDWEGVIVVRTEEVREGWWFTFIY